MKKLFTALAVLALLLPAANASAALTCQQGTLNSENVCVSPATDGAQTRCPNGGNIIANVDGSYSCAWNPVDTSTNPQTTCDQGVAGARYIPDGMGGGTWVCPNGATSNGTTGQSTPPTQSYSSANPVSNTGSKTLTYVPLEPLPGGDQAAYNSLARYLNLMFNILLSIGAMIAVVTLVLGGITFMVSEVVDKRAQAKRRIQAAFIGLGILLTCWLILNTINPNLTKFNLPLPAAPGSGDSGSANTASTIPTQQQAQIQQQDCIKGGAMCALNPKEGGGFTCDCVGA